MLNKQLKNKAVKELILGILGVVIFIFVVAYLNYETSANRGGYFLIAAALPFLFIIKGLVVLITNKPINELEDWWEQLSSIKKLFIGVFVVTIAFIFAIGCLAIYGTFFM